MCIQTILTHKQTYTDVNISFHVGALFYNLYLAKEAK